MAAHPATLAPDDLLRQCQATPGRASGPGGQHRNKVQTAVVLTHPPTGVTGQASERRERTRNLSVALFRLRLNLALAVRESVPLAEVPSPRWRARVRDGRLAISPRHEDYPALLAEALDVLEACQGDFARTARLLEVTPSQLVKLLRAEPRALAQVNQTRALRGDHPLR